MEASNMCFKILICALMSLVLFSCGLKVGEPAPKNEVVEIQNTKCLNRSIENIKLFFDGQASDEDVDSSFKCISQVLIAFKNNVNGANRDFFAPEELSYFIETNFLNEEHSFRSEFLLEIMQLKVVLLGGSKNVFYKKDIEQLSVIIDRLRPDIVRLNPIMKIVTNNWDYSGLSDKEKEEKFIAAKIQSAHFFEILSAEFARSGHKYEADQFLNLIKEIAIFAKAESSVVDKIEKARPFLLNFKQNLVGEGTEIKSGDWKKISNSMHEMLFQVLRMNYFLKPLQPEQREEKWIVYQKITEDVLQLISTLLEAQTKPVLSNQQVYELISSLLPVFSDQTIDIELVESIADIKIALLGQRNTSSNQWVPSDLNRIKAKLPILFTEIREVLGLFQELNAITPVWKKSYPDFNRIELSFNQSVQNLLTTFEGQYTLNSAKKLLLSLDKNKLLPGFELPEKFEGLFKTALSLKYMLTGEQGSQLTNDQMKQVITVVAASYFHYLEYTNYIDTFTLQQSSFYTAVDNVIPKVNKTLTTVLNFKPTKLITTNEFLSLYYTLQDEKIIDVNLSLNTVGSLLEVLWTNILVTPERRLKGATLSGFDSEALQTLVSEAKIFSQSGQDTALIFGPDQFLDQSTVVARIEALLNGPNKPLQYETLFDLKRVVYGPVAMTFDSNKYLRFFDLKTYQANDIFQIQIARTLSRFLIRSYSQDITAIRLLTGVTLPEAEAFFNSLKPLFYDLDLISPSNTTFISSRFREANLFVSHANGDQLANYEELTDIVLHIFSGLERAQILRDQSVQKCLPPQNDPITGETLISEDCLIQHYFDAANGFESIPEFQNLKTQFTQDQNKKYYLSLLKAAGHIPNDQKNVKFEDANLFPHVVQYIEVIFARYDANIDGVLSKEEALTAYPVFKSTIKDMLKVIPNGNKITDAQLPGVFIYLLKNGRPPKGLAETLKFLGFINDEKQWIIQSNRLDLGVIFNFIADSLAKP